MRRSCETSQRIDLATFWLSTSKVFPQDGIQSRKQKTVLVGIVVDDSNISLARRCVAGIEGVDQWRLNGLNPATTLWITVMPREHLASFSGAGNMVGRLLPPRRAIIHSFLGMQLVCAGNGSSFLEQRELRNQPRQQPIRLRTLHRRIKLHYSGRANFLACMAELQLVDPSRIKSSHECLEAWVFLLLVGCSASERIAAEANTIGERAETIHRLATPHR
jgi:hypothetical protein